MLAFLGTDKFSQVAGIVIQNSPGVTIVNVRVANQDRSVSTGRLQNGQSAVLASISSKHHLTLL
jgi:hypothetical protein